LVEPPWVLHAWTRRAWLFVEMRNFAGGLPWALGEATLVTTLIGRPLPA
jgi:hypothetical protein